MNAQRATTGRGFIILQKLSGTTSEGASKNVTRTAVTLGSVNMMKNPAVVLSACLASYAAKCDAQIRHV